MIPTDPAPPLDLDPDLDPDLAPGELELLLLRTELRAMVKRWRFNLAQDGAGKHSRKDLIEIMVGQIESVLENTRL